MNSDAVAQIKQLVKDANHTVIVQADNPDGDSMGAALALEQILFKLDVEASMYCAVDIPSYLRYMSGWDRVTSQLPKAFDLSIIVDNSTMTLLEKAYRKGDTAKLAKQPAIVLDHHSLGESTISFATVSMNEHDVSSTGELIYHIASENDWPIDETSGEHIMTAILGDTQGLSNELAKPSTYRVMADLVELGVKRPQLEERRRQSSKMPESIFRYKGELIARTKLYHDNQLALTIIPQSEINQHSALYNPAPLIQTDMLQIEHVAIAIVLKQYNDGTFTAAIRCNNGYEIAEQLAASFGGGGHPYAAGFKTLDYASLDDIKAKIIGKADELLRTIRQEPSE